MNTLHERLATSRATAVLSLRAPFLSALQSPHGITSIRVSLRRVRAVSGVQATRGGAPATMHRCSRSTSARGMAELSACSVCSTAARACAWFMRWMSSMHSRVTDASAPDVAAEPRPSPQAAGGAAVLRVEPVAGAACGAGGGVVGVRGGAARGG